MLRDKRSVVDACGIVSCRNSAEALARAFNYRLWPRSWMPQKSSAGEGVSTRADEDEEFFEASPPSPENGGDGVPLAPHRSAATEAGREKLFELLQQHATDDAIDVFYDVSEGSTCNSSHKGRAVVVEKPTSVNFTDCNNCSNFDGHGVDDGIEQGTVCGDAVQEVYSEERIAEQCETLCEDACDEARSLSCEKLYVNGLDSSAATDSKPQKHDELIPGCEHQEQDCHCSESPAVENSSYPQVSDQTSAEQHPRDFRDVSSPDSTASSGFVDVDLSSNSEPPSVLPEETIKSTYEPADSSLSTAHANVFGPSDPEADSGAVSIEVTRTTSLSPLTDIKSPLASRLHVFDDFRPIISRSTSLKTGKTPPGTPGRKKMVRFADVFGLDLEDVRHIMTGDIPVIPSSAYTHLNLKGVDLDSYRPVSRTVEIGSRTSPGWNDLQDVAATVGLHPAFDVPGDQQDFLDRVRSQGVCLESVLVSGTCVHCTCRVMNYGYHKRVAVRYTVDNWNSVSDVDALYVPGSSRDGTDQFRFSVFLTASSRGVQFAIKYAVGGREYWDNNRGQNYVMNYRGHDMQQPEPGSPWTSHQFW